MEDHVPLTDPWLFAGFQATTVTCPLGGSAFSGDGEPGDGSCPSLVQKGNQGQHVELLEMHFRQDKTLGALTMLMQLLNQKKPVTRKGTHTQKTEGH